MAFGSVVLNTRSMSFTSTSKWPGESCVTATTLESSAASPTLLLATEAVTSGTAGNAGTAGRAGTAGSAGVATCAAMADWAATAGRAGRAASVGLATSAESSGIISI